MRDTLETPYGKIDVSVTCLLAEERKNLGYHEARADQYSVNVNNEGRYTGTYDEQKPLIVNGVAYRFSTTLESIDAGITWRTGYSTIERVDHAEVTDNARRKIYNLRSVAEEWITLHPEALPQAWRAALKAAAEKARAEADERDKEAAALRKKAAAYEAAL